MSAMEPAGRSTPRWAWIAVVVVAVLAFGTWVLASASTGAGEDGRPTGEAVIQEFPPADRQRVEPFTGLLLDGRRFDSTDMTGVTVYNMWGSWCAPCRREAPDLRRLADELEGRAAFVGINVRDSDGSARAFERANRIRYPSIRTADSSQAMLAFGTSLGVAAVPTTMVVDTESRLAARVVGPVSYATLKVLVENVLASAPKHP